MTFADFATLKQELHRDEGVRLKPYVDSVGKITIGCGRNLTDVGIMPFEADDMLDHDIASVLGALTVKLSWFSLLDTVRQRALINMGFMGVDKLLGFHKMLEALRQAVQTGEQRFYDAAAEHLMDSKYATQVGQRAVRLAAMVRTGTV